MGELGTVSALSDLLNGQPISARRAAEIAAEKDLHLPYGTIAAYWSGKHGRPSQSTLTRLAEVLKMPVEQLQRAAWNVTAPLGMWQPPDEAALLDQRQRDLLGELIKSIAATRGAGNGMEDAPEQNASGEASENEEAKRKVHYLNPRDQGADLDDPPPPVELADAARTEPGYIKSGERPENQSNE